MKMIEAAELIARSAWEGHGWDALIVGGWVRDFVDRVQPNDLDMEIFCPKINTECNPELVHNWLKELAPNVKEVGKAFGVFDFNIEGFDVQVSMPRVDSKVELGHSGFVAEVNPYMSYHNATFRRDITQNAMLYNPLMHELFDYHNSAQDVIDGRIKVVDPIKFGDDPLRVMRLARFVTRKRNYVTDGTTLSACMRSVLEFATLPADRIWGEWRKIALGKYPGNALKFMRECELIKVFPILERLYSIQQGVAHHPEGVVFFHTINAMDKSAIICDRDEVSSDDRVVSVLASMLHDVTKVDVDPNDRTVNYDHAQTSAEEAFEFLEFIGAPRDICARVYKLVELHMRGVGSKTATKSMVRRLARDIHPSTIAQWLRLREADKTSRQPSLHLGLSKSAQDVARIANKLSIEEDKPEQILKGRHLLSMGMESGPRMGEILREAYEYQLNGEFDTLEYARSWVLHHYPEEVRKYEAC